MFENVFETVNSGFAQALYEDYLRDPESVPPEWRALFENGLQGETPPPSPAPSPPPASEPPRPATSPEALAEPIKGPALRLLQNMEQSLTIPTATSFRDIDVSLLWTTRRQVNEQLREHGKKLSFTHFIGWAIVTAARRFPVMGHAVAHYDGEPHRLEARGINLGLAVDLEGKGGKRRLLVPVIRDADQLDFVEFHEEYERLVAGARDGQLMPDAYVGATMTLTNPGTLGTVASVPRLMRGQGSILATGAIRDISGAKTMTVTSTYDHRIIQGAESGLFLGTVDELLQGKDGFYDRIAEALGVELRSLAPTPQPPAPAPAAYQPEPGEDLLQYVAAATALVGAYRTHGYLAARLDPLGTEPLGDPALHPKSVGLTPEIMTRIPAGVLGVHVPGGSLADALPKLQETYCGTIAYEIEHIASHEQRFWLRRVIESGEHRQPFSTDERRAVLNSLIKTATLEEFLHRTYLGQKRFGIEGLEVLIPLLELAVELAAVQGARDVVMGMAHRGRLNVLTHILGLPAEALLTEFEGGHDTHDTLVSGRSTGDVKYHFGASGLFETSRGTVDVILMPNPSHLEAVNPVVEGHVRASQTDRNGVSVRHDPTRVVPILIHGDAAFAAQGVVAETLNLSCLPGYDTGGTLHIIANNQIGFTTDPTDARSTDFASDLAKGFDIPIVHVNADDPEACLAAIRLAMMYRERFHDDCVINVVGYRRYGHNEGDEPRYTHPLMYKRIDAHPTVTQLYGRMLVEQGVVTTEEIESEANRAYQHLAEAHARIKAGAVDDETAADESSPSSAGEWSAASEPDTRVAAELLRQLDDDLRRVPDGFTVNPKLQRLLERRRKAFRAGGPVDWAHAEALALGALLTEAIPLRLVGQDTVRGTFSQRHLMLRDAERGDPYTPIQHLASARAPIELHNSPLSEYAALGFEYGYSVATPETMVMWEAQFGDFANGGQVIIDQFVIAGRAKWGVTSRLVLLLPHGYEGQGPEHSSARLERYLALGAELNIRVANCSTPAQYFHLLRRQALHPQVRPLILMTPKSLLRHPKAVSAVSELAEGGFQHVLDDPSVPAAAEEVTRIVFCSGKVYYDAIAAPQRASAANVAIARIELLYPFPEDAVSALLTHYPKAREIVWLQEEPMNMGARKWVVPQLRELAPEWTEVRYVARPERSSPAEGYLIKHQQEQERLVAEVLGPPTPVTRRG